MVKNEDRKRIEFTDKPIKNILDKTDWKIK